MKTLELNQMEKIEGGSWAWAAGFTCGFAVAAVVAGITVATAGLGAFFGLIIGGALCNVTLSESLN